MNKTILQKKLFLPFLLFLVQQIVIINLVAAQAELNRQVVLATDDTAMLPHAPIGFDKKRENIERGKTDSVQYYSATVGNTRKLLVYTPPGYTPTKQYPVLYLLHGIGGTEKEWYKYAEPNVILDNLYADGKVVPMIVVYPNGRAMKNDADTGNIFAPEKVQAFANFENDLLNDVIPYVESHYAVIKNRESRALAGYSMGGGQSLNFGLGHMDVFAYVGGFSSAPNSKKPIELVPNPAESVQKIKLLYLSCGDKDGLISFNQGLHRYLKEHNVPHVWEVVPGVHNMDVWVNDLYLFSQRIFIQARTVSVNDTLQSVRVSSDDRVTFSIFAPKASEVTVGGDFTLGAPAAKLSKADNGVWSYTTNSIPQDSYTYNFSVDGVNTMDTKSAEFKENPNGLFNYFTMEGPETDFFALKNVPHGRVESVLYHSNSLDADRRLHVYLPPGFEHIKGKLPVLYLLHGGGDNDLSWTGAAKANLILDNLYAQGKLKNMIVVMPAGHTAAKGFSMGTGPQGDPFCTDLLNDIIPLIEKTYPVSTKRDDRAIAGFSMGGVQTLNIALWNPDKFGYVCPMGTGFFPNSIKEIDEKYSTVFKNPAINQFKLFYIGKGKDDNLTAVNCRATREMFDKYSIKYQYQKFPGAHSFVFTRRYLQFFAPLLFR